MRSMTVALTLALTLSLLAPAALAAEKSDPKIEKQIEDALKAYREGNANDAISLLQAAVAAIQKTQRGGLAGFFPKPGEAWEAGKLDSNSMSADGGDGATSMTMINQTFTRKQDKVQVEVSLTDSPVLAQAQKQMAEAYKDPAALEALAAQSGLKMRFLREPGWAGWVKTEKEGGTEAVAFTGTVVLTLRGTKDTTGEAVEAILKSMDLKGLAEMAAKSAEKTPKTPLPKTPARPRADE